MRNVAVGDRVSCHNYPATVIRVRPSWFAMADLGCVVQFDDHAMSQGVVHFGIPGTWWVLISELDPLELLSDLPNMDA